MKVEETKVELKIENVEDVLTIKTLKNSECISLILTNMGVRVPPKRSPKQPL